MGITFRCYRRENESKEMRREVALSSYARILIEAIADAKLFKALLQR